MGMETGTGMDMVTAMVTMTATGTETAMGRRNTGILTMRKELREDISILTGISRRIGLWGTITSMIMRSARTRICSPWMLRLFSLIIGQRSLSLSTSTMVSPHYPATKIIILTPLLPNCSLASKDQ